MRVQIGPLHYRTAAEIEANRELRQTPMGEAGPRSLRLLFFIMFIFVFIIIGHGLYEVLTYGWFSLGRETSTVNSDGTVDNSVRWLALLGLAVACIIVFGVASCAASSRPNPSTLSAGIVLLPSMFGLFGVLMAASWPVMWISCFVESTSQNPRDARDELRIIRSLAIGLLLGVAICAIRWTNLSAVGWYYRSRLERTYFWQPTEEEEKAGKQSSAGQSGGKSGGKSGGDVQSHNFCGEPKLEDFSSFKPKPHLIVNTTAAGYDGVCDAVSFPLSTDPTIVYGIPGIPPQNWAEIHQITLKDAMGASAAALSINMV